MKHSGVLRYVVLLLFPALLPSCTRMNVTGLNDHPPPHVRNWKQVEVFEEIGEVTRDYREIAVLEIRSAATRKRMLHDSRRQAARLGANGIVLEQVGRHEVTILLHIGGAYMPVVSEQWEGRVLAIHVNRAPPEAVAGPFPGRREGIS